MTPDAPDGGGRKPPLPFGPSAKRLGPPQAARGEPVRSGRKRRDAAPDVPSAVVAWRQWALRGGDGRPRLVSPVRPTRWEPGEELVAVCPQGHLPPADGCSCGLYAHRLVGGAAQAVSGLPAVEVVLGRVAMWGEIVEGERGYRATRAYPSVLFVDSEVDDDVVAALREDYRVPVHRVPMRISFFRALPEPAIVRTVRAPGQRRQDRIIELLGEHRAAADAVTRDRGADRFLRLSRELFDQLRRASLVRLVREVALMTVAFCLVPDLWALDIHVDAGAWMKSRPDGLQTLSTIVVFVGMAAAFVSLAWGVRLLRRMLGVRILHARQVFAVCVLPVLFAAVLQWVSFVAITHDGRGFPSLWWSFAAIPVIVATLGLVGWRKSFPEARREVRREFRREARG